MPKEEIVGSMLLALMSTMGSHLVELDIDVNSQMTMCMVLIKFDVFLVL